MIGVFIFNDMIDLDYIYMDSKCKKDLLNIAFNKRLVDEIKVCTINYRINIYHIQYTF